MTTVCYWSCLDQNESPVFCLNQGPSNPANLMIRVKTLLEPCLLQARPSVPCSSVENEDIWFLTERDWSQESFLGNDPDIGGVIWFHL